MFQFSEFFTSEDLRRLKKLREKNDLGIERLLLETQIQAAVIAEREHQSDIKKLDFGLSKNFDEEDNRRLEQLNAERNRRVTVHNYKFNFDKRKGEGINFPKEEGEFPKELSNEKRTFTRRRNVLIKKQGIQLKRERRRKRRISGALLTDEQLKELQKREEKEKEFFRKQEIEDKREEEKTKKILREIEKIGGIPHEGINPEEFVESISKGIAVRKKGETQKERKKELKTIKKIREKHLRRIFTNEEGERLDTLVKRAEKIKEKDPFGAPKELEREIDFLWEKKQRLKREEAKDAREIIKASEEGDIKRVAELLEDPNVDPSLVKNKPIRRASRMGHAKVVKLLLEDDRVDPSDKSNEAINEAAYRGYVEVIKLLLNDNRFDLNKGRNPIQIATWNGHFDAVKFLLDDGKYNPGDNKNLAILNAVRQGHKDILKLLMKDPRVDPSDRENSPIRRASDHPVIFKLLMKDPRVDPSVNNDEILQETSRAGNIKIVKLLLGDERVNPASNTNNSIRWATIEGHFDIVKLLIKHPKTYIDIIRMLSNPKFEYNEEIVEYAKSIVDLHYDILAFLKTDYSDTDFLELLKDTKDIYGWGYQILLDEGTRRCDKLEEVEQSFPMLSGDELWHMTRF